MPAKEKYGDAVLATEELPDNSNNLERFSYKDNWVNARNTFKRRLGFSFIATIIMLT